MTVTTIATPLTLAQAFGRAINGASDRAARRAAIEGVHRRSDRLPDIATATAGQSDRMPSIDDVDPVTQRIDADRAAFLIDEHPLDTPAHTVKGWLGSRGSVVLTSHLALDEHPDETFVVVDLMFYADQGFADALRHLQDDGATLRQRVWELEDSAS